MVSMYVAVATPTLDELRSSCQLLITAGFRPSGGVSYIPGMIPERSSLEVAAPQAVSGRYCQVMWCNRALNRDQLRLLVAAGILPDPSKAAPAADQAPPS